MLCLPQLQDTTSELRGRICLFVCLLSVSLCLSQSSSSLLPPSSLPLSLPHSLPCCPRTPTQSLHMLGRSTTKQCLQPLKFGAGKEGGLAVLLRLCSSLQHLHVLVLQVCTAAHSKTCLLTKYLITFAAQPHPPSHPTHCPPKKTCL